MNSHLKINIIISLFIFSCTDDKIQIISNIPPDLPDQNYKINLKSNSGSFLANATIYWDATEGEVELYDTGDSINFNGNSHTFSGMNPGEFRDILINVRIDDSPYVDSIQIFTRPVYPVSNFRYEVEMVMRGNGDYDFGESYTDLDTNNTWNEGEVFIDIKNPKYHRVLNWSTTAELDDNFTNYILYRVANNDADDLINSENCGCEIATLTKANTSFIDSMVTEESGIYAYFYQIRVISESDGRNSYIYNYTDFTSLSKVSLVDADVSKNNNEFIQIMWEPVSNSTYFYQYEIWRSSKENSENPQRLAVITNSEQGKFMDRNVGNGTTWYYSVAVIDINGQRKYSDYISGWSNP